MMTYTLYILFCPNTLLPRYIGITRQELKTRFQQHLYKGTENTHKANWIQSLRRTNKKPLCVSVKSSLTEQQAISLEEIYITMYRLFYGDSITNLSSGGETRKHSEETLRKLKEKCSGWKQTDEAKRKMSTHRKGRKFGPASEKRKQSIRNALLGKRMGGGLMLSKPVQQLSDNGNVLAEFVSVGEAAKQMKTTHSNITTAIKNSNRTAKGYKWRWKNA